MGWLFAAYVTIMVVTCVLCILFGCRKPGMTKEEWDAGIGWNTKDPRGIGFPPRPALPGEDYYAEASRGPHGRP